jgi:ubiquinone/menaquinone biosynthesis C-methylase UbiE
VYAKKIVRAGYNKIALSYATARTDDSDDLQLLNLLVGRLPKGATVLDAGCGSGYPVAQFLAKFFHVVGMDFAEKQIHLARERVPDATFVCGELSNMPFRKDSFDAVCSYYAIIHVPRQVHLKLLRDMHRILRMSGLVLLCMGAGDLPRDIDDYHGAKMYWSHYDSKTNLQMMNQSKFEILWSKIVQDPIDPHASHLFVLGQKR